MYGGFRLPAEPPVKRALAFVDGQNLYHAARAAFGHTHPNYDVRALSAKVCESRGWALTDWIRIDRATYDACLNRRDYRPKLSPGEPT